MGALATACRPAAEPTTCAREDVLVRGACVSEATAARYCGAAERWEADAGACVLRACEKEQVRDLSTGACVGARALRALGEREHVVVDAEQVLGCSAGLELRVVGESARCVDAGLDDPTGPGGRHPPPSGACARGDVWDGKACARIVRGGRVDIGSWARATFGPAAATSPRFCARAALDPAPFGLLSGASTTLEASIELVVPDNDVTTVYSRVTPLHPLPSGALARVVGAVEAEIELLRAMGGTAEVAGYMQPIACTVRAGATPVAVPKPTLPPSGVSQGVPQRQRNADENR
jgi:hypothetical protein